MSETNKAHKPFLHLFILFPEELVGLAVCAFFEDLHQVRGINAVMAGYGRVEDFVEVIAPVLEESLNLSRIFDFKVIDDLLIQGLHGAGMAARKIMDQVLHYGGLCGKARFEDGEVAVKIEGLPDIGVFLQTGCGQPIDIHLIR